MSAAPSLVTVDGLVPGNCYNAVEYGHEEYLGKFIRTDVDLVRANNAGGHVNVRTEQKTCVFELGTRKFRGYGVDGVRFFTQVECRIPGSGGAAPNPAYEALKEALRTTRMPDGTYFSLGKEFRHEKGTYLTVTARSPDGKDRTYKIYLDGFLIEELWGVITTNPKLLADLESVVSPFRPAAKDASRRSARKQRKSRRTNRRKGTRQRSSKK